MYKIRVKKNISETKRQKKLKLEKKKKKKKNFFFSMSSQAKFLFRSVFIFHLKYFLHVV